MHYCSCCIADRWDRIGTWTGCKPVRNYKHYCSCCTAVFLVRIYTSKGCILYPPCKHYCSCCIAKVRCSASSACCRFGLRHISPTRTVYSIGYIRDRIAVLRHTVHRSRLFCCRCHPSTPPSEKQQKQALPARICFCSPCLVSFWKKGASVRRKHALYMEYFYRFQVGK